ncbi:MAG: hypothetical protein GEU93_00355 [Propionibacteriales bacterium]|nr:hypothetical protein [Propionibacteriales bacterium]
MSVFRRRTLPADVASSLPLEPGESVRAAAVDTEGRWYAGTTRALLIPADGAYRRLPWEGIERAEWDGDLERLVVVETADLGEVQPVHRLGLQDPTRFLQFVRERVTASVVVRYFQPVEGGRGITVVARRPPHTDTELSWSFVIDPGLDADSPAVRDAAERGLAEARSQVGA